MKKMNGKTMNIVAENVGKLKELFPEAFTEDGSADFADGRRLGEKINFEVLKELLGEYVSDKEERYSFTWNGKSKARMIAQTPSTGTLRPCKEESVDWNTTQNIFIEGDNLEVLKLLQKSYHKKVKMIYIDPPYNTGKDFVYKDNFKDNIKNYKEITGQVDGEGRNLSNNPETSGRYHTDWLNMMYPRLKLARNLLKDDGVIFISIDANEVANLQKIGDEVFGEECLVTIIHVEMSVTQGMKVKAAKDGNIVKNGEFILVYSRSGEKNIGVRPLLAPTKYDNHYSLFMVETKEEGVFKEKSLTEEIRRHSPIIEELLVLNLIKNENSAIDIQTCYSTSPKFRTFVNENADNIVRTHDTIEMPDSFTAPITDNLIREYNSQERSYLVAKAANGKFYQKIRLSEKLKVADDFNSTYGPTKIRGDWWDGFYLDMGNVNKEGGVQYNNGKKPVRLVRQMVEFCCSQEELILDFFAGSATTAHSVLEHNLRANSKCNFILVQLPEALSNENKEQKDAYKFCIENNLKPSIAEISKERIRRAAAKIKEENPEYDGDLGFKVFKLDSTNIKPWEVDFDLNEQELFDHIENIKPDRREEDVLYEVLLKYGLDLTLPITEHTLGGQKVFDIGMGALIICLSDAISLEVVEGIAKLKDDLNPEIMRVVFKDSGFKDDVVKTNAVQILKQAGIVDVRSL